MPEDKKHQGDKEHTEPTDERVYLTGDLECVDELAADYASRPRLGITYEQIEAKCTYCGKVVRPYVVSGSGLQVDDFVYLDANQPFTGRCPQCTRQGTQKVTRVFRRILPSNVQGFWKLPLGSGASSDTSDDFSGEPKK